MKSFFAKISIISLVVMLSVLMPVSQIDIEAISHNGAQASIVVNNDEFSDNVSVNKKVYSSNIANTIALTSAEIPVTKLEIEGYVYALQRLNYFLTAELLEYSLNPATRIE